ncbi:Rap family tetratricopeptide repeat protein [Shouchella miscanthi]|uniref:Tetratricopeptide repeat protein n=1 Tax=Shouchella miscanthi TaxID=2598861 RepID=A0ABU6NQG6_9BACI|nr:tetratricopeptide repeat protein [Shouchella miscanthi]
MKTYAVERVGQQIVEWYSCIMTKDIKQAKLLKPKVDVMVANMKPDDKMLAYYQLVSMQYDLLMLKVSPDEAKANLDVTILEGIANQANDYLKFMYYYVWGRNEFYQKRYKSAIRTYKIAERLIEKVDDPVEKAEFYQKLGISYYHIDQYTFAFSYLEQALEFFEKDPTYIVNVFTCKHILSGIYSELHQHEKAESIYNELLIATESYPYNYAITKYNIGVNSIALEKYEKAIKHFTEALDIKEFQDSAIYLKAKYHVINLQLRLGNKPEGLEQLEEEVHNKDAKGIKAKLMICRGLYLEDDISLVNRGVEILEANEDFVECRELCREISKHFEEVADSGKALYFLEYAKEMNSKIILGVDQS